MILKLVQEPKKKSKITNCFSNESIEKHLSKVINEKGKEFKSK